MSESFQSQDIILKQIAEKSYDICMISGQIVIMDDLTKNNTTSIFQMKNKTAGTETAGQIQKTTDKVIFS